VEAGEVVIVGLGPRSNVPWPYLGRYEIEELAIDITSDGERFIRLASRRFAWIARVPELPRILSQWGGRAKQRLQRGLDRDALAADLDKIMRPAEALVVPGAETLDRLLNRLLAMEGDDIEQGRCGPEPPAPRRGCLAPP
jgi:hypothetical protein